MRICVAFACALALQTAAWPQESPGALIEYLGHADPDVRVVAERRLLALGAAAHPALREAFDHRDAEVRRR
ncbi:MAG: hypothetical protein O7C98_01210, partial [Planctomycetota bacterium]|nr:hypothetical protein [Planctomycetota bacterium]